MINEPKVKLRHTIIRTDFLVCFEHNSGGSQSNSMLKLDFKRLSQKIIFNFFLSTLLAQNVCYENMKSCLCIINIAETIFINIYFTISKCNQIIYTTNIIMNIIFISEFKINNRKLLTKIIKL